LFLIIISGLFAVTPLPVCTPWFHNTVTSSCSHTGLCVCVCVCTIYVSFRCLVLCILSNVNNNNNNNNNIVIVIIIIIIVIIVLDGASAANAISRDSWIFSCRSVSINDLLPGFRVVLLCHFFLQYCFVCELVFSFVSLYCFCFVFVSLCWLYNWQFCC
jgi:hypothetical protein